jgi:thioredoxin-dependent peroxiredoxin
MSIFSSSDKLKVGDRAPDFALSNHTGQVVKLTDFQGKKAVVLAFYPRASTGGCTREITTYQHDIAKFDAADAQVIGISLDSPERNRKFAEQTSASFPLLSDTDKEVAKAYGVLHFTHLLANRVTFVIDMEGIIRHIDSGSDAVNPAGALTACRLAQP